MNPHTTVYLSVVYRNYMRNFYSFTGNALSENTAAQNERGVYWGWKYRPNRTLQFTGYVDLFTFPWLAFRRYIPSSGYEWLTSIRYAPSKTTRISLQLRRESKARNLSHPAPLYRVWQGVKTNFITQVDYGIGEAIRLRSRVQYNEFLLKEMGTEGFALIQDVSFSYGRFKLTARHAVFESGQFENRHYVYEHDAWLSYSMPAYTDTGVRNYALLEIKMSKRLTLWLRYARTRLQNSDEIGSGGDVIEGNTRNDVKFQARIRF